MNALFTRHPAAWSPSALVALALLSGCAPAAPVVPAAPGATAVDHRPGASPLGGESDEPPEPPPPSPAPVASGAPSAAPPTRPARPARSSHPEGVAPLDEAESERLAKGCKAFTDAITREASAIRSRSKPGASPAELTQAAFEAVVARSRSSDDARCAELMRRELEVYVARSSETQAIVMLRSAALTLSQRWSDEQRLCPSAGPVPREVELLRQPRTRDELGAGLEAVRCASPNFGDSPTRWSLEIRTDQAAKTWEIVARGFPVKRGPVAELFVAGVVGPEGIDPAVEVMRR